MAENKIWNNLDLLKNNWPLICSIIILWTTIYILYLISIELNQGNFIYALDDAYIHLAVSKNLLLHGVFGISPYAFTSSSSSIIWSILLTSIFYFSGLNSIIPFILNIIFATGSLLVVNYFLKLLKVNSFYILLTLIAIIFFTPLPALIFTGMEHTLQIILIIPFAYFSAVTLTKENLENKEIYLLILLAIALTLVRYEDFFLVLIVSFLFFVRRRYFTSLSLFGFALIPIVIFGIISVLKGWFFLPNSIIFKSTLQTDIASSNLFIGILTHISNQINENPVVLILIILMLTMIALNYHKKQSIWNLSSILAITFLGTAFLQILFANMGWFYRYEAYLVALGIFIFSIGYYKYIKEYLNSDKNLKTKIAVIIVISLVIFSPMIYRGCTSLADTPQATNNIYEQQYQMGLFIETYYSNQTVAIVDVGAVNYLANVKTLDLRGLTDFNISKHLQKGDYTTSVISGIVKQNKPRVIIVYDGLFKSYGGIPNDWIKVGQWKIKNNVVTEFDSISFYVINEEEKKKLIENLKNFSDKLPKDVEQVIFY